MRLTPRSLVWIVRQEYFSARKSRFCFQSISTLAFAFDIDGVLKKGNHVLPQGQAALKLLKQLNIPFILITNGGGIKEIERADALSKDFDTEIPPNQIIQSHTPMQSLVADYGSKNVLVVGGVGTKCREVAEEYGFKSVIIPNDLIQLDQSIWPFKKLSNEETNITRNLYDYPSIEAIMAFHDSRDWGRDLQIMMDILLSENGQMGTTHQTKRQAVPVFFSNPDFLWSNEHLNPRFGQGALHVALKALYSTATGRSLEYTCFGKPHTVTFTYAHLRLKMQDSRITNNVYMVGDNPAADIAGANRYGWHSILVKTGVFREGENDSTFPAEYVVENVYDAVKLALGVQGKPSRHI